ncbi:MAG: methyltransferase [Eubacteriales bacterium]|nr:methyltransferase [Eubacteriales bacterium]
MNKRISDLQNGIDVRKNLIDLRSLIKDAQEKRTLAYFLAGDFSVFTGLLKNEDPKVRKNAALILGEMECDDMAEILWEAYLSERTLFVRPDYLKAMQKLDCSRYTAQMKKRLQFLLNTEIPAEAEKHVRQETAALNQILMQYERPKKHRFSGYDQELELILITNRNHREVTLQQLKALEDTECRMLSGGIRLKTSHLREILEIRTWTELLFAVPGCTKVGGSPAEIAAALCRSGLTEFIGDLHDGRAPFYFRLDIRSRADADQRTDMIKKIAACLEKETKGALMNTASGYELELRLVASRQGDYLPVLKFYSIPEKRFSYRTESLPTSIAPANAALVMQLAKDHLSEGAQVLDPFCGAGTMLIERNKYGRVRSMYGLDIFGEAIEKAKINTENAGQLIHYIHRDYFDFQHDYLFDEIVTNLPSVGKARDTEQIRLLYRRFLEKSAALLKTGAVVIAVTPQPQLLEEAVQVNNEYRTEKNFCLNERDGNSVLILKFQRG